MSSLIGQTVGNYQVTGLLGEGGMGIVYQAEHPIIGRKVAIKLLHLSMAKDSEIVARFFNEARAIHTIRHENIVEILDFGQTTDGQPYFIMEFLAGEAMNDRLARGAIAPPQVAEIADQICRALAAAHEKGIIHRDLKPHNVHLLTLASGRIQVKLLDFGVAKIMNAADNSQSVKTRTGSLMGTPMYMSPEQCRGAGTIDHRTDIYSLGVMLYEMLAGRPPFVAEGVGALLALHMLQPPPLLTDFAPGTPPAMAAAVMRTLAKDPADRFPSMEALRQAILADAAPAVPPAASGESAMRRPAGTQRIPATTLVAPESRSTTFSSAPGELDDDIAPAKKSRAGLALATIALAAAGIGSYLVMARGGGKADDPLKAHGSPAASASEPASEPAGTAAATATATDPPARGKTVTIRFEAEPPETHVFRETDDRDLGAVPLQLKLPRSGGKPEYVLRAAGYQDKSISADLTSDQTLRAALEKLGPPPPPVAAPPPASGASAKGDDKGDPGQRKPPAPRRPRRPSAPADEDGLATPSF